MRTVRLSSPLFVNWYCNNTENKSNEANKIVSAKAQTKNSIPKSQLRPFYKYKYDTLVTLLIMKTKNFLMKLTDAPHC